MASNDASPQLVATRIIERIPVQAYLNTLLPRQVINPIHKQEEDIGIFLHAGNRPNVISKRVDGYVRKKIMFNIKEQ